MEWIRLLKRIYIGGGSSVFLDSVADCVGLKPRRIGLCYQPSGLCVDFLKEAVSNDSRKLIPLGWGQRAFQSRKKSLRVFARGRCPNALDGFLEGLL